MRRIISFVLVLLLVMGMNITVFADVTDSSVISNSDVTTGPALETVTKGAADQVTDDGIKSDVTQNTQGLSGSLPIKKLDTVPDGYTRIEATSGGGIGEKVSTNFCINNIDAVKVPEYRKNVGVLQFSLVKNGTTIIEVKESGSVDVTTLDIVFSNGASKVTLSDINNKDLSITPFSHSNGSNITIDGQVTLKGFHNGSSADYQNYDNKLQGINNGTLNFEQSYNGFPVNVTISDIVINADRMFLQARKQMTISNTTFNLKSTFSAHQLGVKEDGELNFNNCIFNLGDTGIFSEGKLAFNGCKGTLKYFIPTDKYEYSRIVATDIMKLNMNPNEELRLETTTRDIGPFDENGTTGGINNRALTGYNNILLSNNTGVYSLEGKRLAINEVDIQLNKQEPGIDDEEIPDMPTSVHTATYSDKTPSESVVIKGVLGDDAANKKDQPKTSDSTLLYIWILGIIVSAFVLQEVFRKAYR